MADLFRGAIIRDCLVKCVVDGKTLKVLLNPLGWAPKPSGGWLARPTSATAPLRGPSEEVRDGLVDAAAAIPHAYRRDMSADALPVRVVAAFYGGLFLPRKRKRLAHNLSRRTGKKSPSA